MLSFSFLSIPANILFIFVLLFLYVTVFLYVTCLAAILFSPFMHKI